MEEKHKAKFPKMAFKVMNALDMKEFLTGTFNIVIDKGTLDSVLCGDNSESNAQKMISEVFRILAPGGYYFCISYGDAEHRKKHFETQAWGKLTVEKIIKPATSSTSNVDEKDPKNYHYIYIMNKAK